MPGSNEYSKAPENRTGASKSNTTSVSTVKKEITNPSKDLTAMKMKTIPGQINLTSILSKPAPTQSRLDMDIRHHAAKTLSKPAALQSQVDMDLTHVLAKMPDEMKQEMVTHGNKLVNKPKWSATNASVDAGATTYKVQAGNTLGQIVADYNKKNGTALKWQDVAKWNSIDPSKMKIGQVINFADPTAQIVEQKPDQPVDNNTEQNISLPGGNTKPALDSLGVQSPIDTAGRTTLDSLAVKNGPAAPQLDSAAIAAAIDSADVKIANILKAAGTPSDKTRPSFDLASMMTSRGWKPATIQIPKSKYSTFNKQGGTMNRINYFQQGGAAPQQQDLQQQIIALVQAAMQGDQKATETVNKIMEAAKAGDQQAVQLAQMIQQVVEQMKGQATAAKWGAKLGYIKSLKYAKGGKACPACEKGKQIEMKACGGKKAKKRYFGGLV